MAEQQSDANARLLTSLHVPNPAFDWSAPDQHEELRLFRTQLSNWFEIKDIPNAKRKACVLSLLGKEGVRLFERWSPTTADDRDDYGKFLDYIESTLTDSVSRRVLRYQLEDVRKRSDEPIDVLYERIKLMAQRAKVGGGTAEAIEYTLQQRLVRAIPDSDVELRKKLLELDDTKTSKDMLEVCRSYYSVVSGAAAMSDTSRSVHAISKKAHSR